MTPAKAKTPSKEAKATKVPKADLKHPKYEAMISSAIKDLKERTGSSIPAISRYFQGKVAAKEWELPANWETTLKLQLKRLTASGKLVKVKASYKLGDDLKRSLARVGKKSATAAKPKAGKEKKPAAPKPVKSEASKTAKPAKKATPKKKKVESAVTKPKALPKKPKSVAKKPKAKATPTKKTGKTKPAVPKKAAGVTPKKSKTTPAKKATTPKKTPKAKK